MHIASLNDGDRQEKGESMSAFAGFALKLAGAGEKVRILKLRGTEEMIKRIEAMGLRRGEEINVLQTEGAGGLLVQVGATRLALGSSISQRIMVCKI